MKIEFPSHPKFLRLVRVLDEQPSHVLGYIEMLWYHCYQMGSPEIGDATTVEGSADYRGPAGKFAEAAKDCELLERDAQGKYRVHDLWDHAPEYVKRRMARKGHAPPGHEQYGGGKPATSKAAARSQTKKKPPTAPAEAVEIPVTLNTPEFRAAWQTWQQDRNERKLGWYTSRGEATQLSHLAKYGPAIAVEAIQESIRNKYQGLFPEKIASKQNGGANKPARTDRVEAPKGKYDHLETERVEGDSTATGASESGGADGGEANRGSRTEVADKVAATY